MPEKRLIADALETDGEVCAIGAAGKARGIDMSLLEPEDGDGVAAAFDISRALALEIVYMNDEAFDRETPEERFLKMREWIAGRIRPSPPREGGR